MAVSDVEGRLARGAADDPLLLVGVALVLEVADRNLQQLGHHGWFWFPWFAVLQSKSVDMSDSQPVRTKVRLTGGAINKVSIMQQLTAWELRQAYALRMGCGEEQDKLT